MKAASRPRAAFLGHCNCPNDASAVLAARRLLEGGFKQVRPLAGGLDASGAVGRSVDLERL